jgi:hypothetical protein
MKLSEQVAQRDGSHALVEFAARTGSWLESDTGVVPSEHSSGAKSRRGKITKAGSSPSSGPLAPRSKAGFPSKIQRAPDQACRQLNESAVEGRGEPSWAAQPSEFDV